MKIAILINTSWNIYNFRRGLVQKFLSDGNEVMAIAPKDEYSQKLLDLGCSFHHVNMEGSGMNPVGDFTLLLRLIKVLRNEMPDVLLTYPIKPNIYGSIASGFLGIPCICNVSGLGTVFLWKGYVKKLAVSLYSFAFRFSKWIFFQNEEDQADFLSAVKVKKGKTSILPGSGVDLNHFSYSKLEKASGPTVFLMISRLIVEKGVREFVEAARIIKETNSKIEFWLLGSFDPSHRRSIDRQELNEWIDEGVIRWIDHMEDTRPVISKAEVIVLPSYREGTPKTLLEAGAMGRAMIASDVPGCRQVVVDGVNGFLCHVKNGKDLANKIKLYMSLSFEERTEMSKASRAWIEKKYDETLVIDLYVRKIEELTQNS